MTAKGHDSLGGGSTFVDLPASPQGSDHLFISIDRDGWRMASEDPVETVSCWFSGMALVVPSTKRIVTVIATPMTSTEWMHPGLPAYSQLHSPTSPLGGAAPLACQGAYCNLRTVIVRTVIPISLWGLDHIFIPSLQKGALRMASEDSRSSAMR
jgi:hypothetical protein